MILTSEQRSILAEFQRRQSLAIHKYVPSNQEDHNQLSYHKSLAHIRLLFGGNQSGKSHAAAYDCAIHAIGNNKFTNQRYLDRDYVIWVISTEYTTITNGIYRHLNNIIPDYAIEDIGPNVAGGHRLPTFIKVKRQKVTPDAEQRYTTISFMSAKGSGQEVRSKFQAAAVDYFYIDEEIASDIWEELQARTLATGGRFSISATLVESYDWIVQLEDQAEKFIKNKVENPPIQITRLNTEKNIYLDMSRVAHLKSTWSEETLQYRFYGKSRLVTGLIYRFTQDHIVQPFPIPPEWPRWCAIDPGIRTCAVLWVAVSPEGRAYAYRELYAQNEPLWQVAIVIKELEGYKLEKTLSYKLGHYVFSRRHLEIPPEEMVARLIDPKARARSEAGDDSILSQLYSRYGIMCGIADNSVRPGIEDCRFWLQNLEDGRPGFQIFDTLENFQDEVRNYRPRPKSNKKNSNDPIEEPIRRKNHLMDCFRYIARQKPKWSDRKSTRVFLDDNFDEQEEPVMTASEKLSAKRNREEVHDWLGTEW